MDSNTNNERRKKLNDFWFFFALISAVTLIIWFTLAFFREAAFFKNTLGEVRDVSWGALSIGLAVIAGYAAQNKLVHLRCSDVKRKPGEWIVFIVFVWSQVMWAIYQTNTLYSTFGIELYMPEHFYGFVVTIIGMFTGSVVWDFAAYRYMQRNGNGDKGADSRDGQS